VIHLASGSPSDVVATEWPLRSRSIFWCALTKKTRERRALFKSGRRSLIVGFAILSSCFAAGWLAGLILGDGPLPDIVRESFLILGWVAIWKPSEIFLYGWPAIVEERRLFERLSAAAVVLTSVPERLQ
jgi:hypothetical protein